MCGVHTSHYFLLPIPVSISVEINNLVGGKKLFNASLAHTPPQGGVLHFVSESTMMTGMEGWRGFGVCNKYEDFFSFLTCWTRRRNIYVYGR